MEVSDADRRKEWSTNQSGMTQTVGTDADIIGVPRSVLAAACHIIRNSEHAESETAKAMRKYALSTQSAELDALRGEVERIAYFVEPHYKGAGLEAKADWIIEQLSHSSAKREAEIEEAEAIIAQLCDRVAGLEEIPSHIAEQVLSMGRAEWGATDEKTSAEHLADFENTLRLTRENFNYEDIPVRLHGLYLEGTETVLCHTGTSPNSGANAQALAGAWNWLYDQCKARALLTQNEVG